MSDTQDILKQASDALQTVAACLRALDESGQNPNVARKVSSLYKRASVSSPFDRMSWTLECAYNYAQSKDLKIKLNPFAIVVRHLDGFPTAYLLNPKAEPGTVLVFQSDNPVPVREWEIGEGKDEYERKIEAGLLEIAGEIREARPGQYGYTSGEEDEVALYVSLTELVRHNSGFRASLDPKRRSHDEMIFTSYFGSVRQALIHSRNLSRIEYERAVREPVLSPV
ncbi:MAG: hypothetical protein Q7S03_01155 [bacterium]|nr:hypothetical protein [bacterium]